MDGGGGVREGKGGARGGRRVVMLIFRRKDVRGFLKVGIGEKKRGKREIKREEREEKEGK